MPGPAGISGHGEWRAKVHSGDHPRALAATTLATTLATSQLVTMHASPRATEAATTTDGAYALPATARASYPALAATHAAEPTAHTCCVISAAH